MPDIFEYPIGAIIAAIIAVTVSLVTIWATVRRERRDQKREHQAAIDKLRIDLREYIDIKLGQNEELKSWIKRLENRIDKQESEK